MPFSIKDFYKFFLIFLSCTSFASSKDTINEARALLLSGDRAKALKLLVNGIKGEKKDSSRFKEYIKNLENIATLFLTEKGQQNYELGKAVAASDPASAVLHLREALKTEPENEAVIVGLARTFLFQGECDKVLDETKLAYENNPFSKDLALIRIQGLACAQKTAEFKTTINSMSADLSSMPYIVYLESAKAQVAVAEEKWDVALAATEKVKSLDVQFPESYYWAGQALEKSGRDEQTPYKRYVELCQEMTPKKKKAYELEPRICIEQKNIEHAIENKNNKAPKGATWKGRSSCVSCASS